VTATVLLVGTDELPAIPEYLRLGAVVVVAPDRETLRRWQREAGDDPPPPRPAGSEAVLVDFPGRRVLVDEVPLQLSELEFRVLAALLSRPGRAWSFVDLRRAGWGEGPRLVGDVEALRALLQRVRKKLAARGAPVRLAAVRGYGYRAEVAGSPPAGDTSDAVSGSGAA
jgi:DNA-binding response OmpR family regulator